MSPPTIVFKGYAFYCIIYSGEGINDNHLVLEFIPLVKTTNIQYIML